MEVEMEVGCCVCRILFNLSPIHSPPYCSEPGRWILHGTVHVNPVLYNMPINMMLT